MLTWQVSTLSVLYNTFWSMSFTSLQREMCKIETIKEGELCGPVEMHLLLVISQLLILSVRQFGILSRE